MWTYLGGIWEAWEITMEEIHKSTSDLFNIILTVHHPDSSPPSSVDIHHLGI